MVATDFGLFLFEFGMGLDVTVFVFELCGSVANITAAKMLMALLVCHCFNYLLTLSSLAFSLSLLFSLIVKSDICWWFRVADSVAGGLRSVCLCCRVQRLDVFSALGWSWSSPLCAYLVNL